MYKSKIIIKTFDKLGLALVEYKHVWTVESFRIYNPDCDFPVIPTDRFIIKSRTMIGLFMGCRLCALRLT